MKNHEIIIPETPDLDAELHRKIPTREPSATSAPLNNTAALLGPALNQQRTEALQGLSRSRMRILPSVTIV